MQRDTILFAVLYGHETGRFTFICEDILRVLESRVLREIMGSKRDELRGGRSKVYNEELYELQSAQI
jgi:hypothetical protein